MTPLGIRSDRLSEIDLGSFDQAGSAIVIGANGGIGQALYAALSTSNHFRRVVAVSRDEPFACDITDEESIKATVARIAEKRNIRLVIDASGILHAPGHRPEKSWREADPQRLAQMFAINAIGPMLLMKHFLPHMATTGKTVFATLSARVGSISDNRLGGWYGYRASKAALNQFVQTSSIELARRSPDAVCVALHPGTVATALSAGFVKPGPNVHPPEQAACDLLRVTNNLQATDSGGFFDWQGIAVPW